MYDTILVPLDGSKRAEAILPHVEQLAQRYEALVVLLQVVDLDLVTPGIGPDGAHVMLDATEIRRRTREAESYLAGWEGEFREKGIKVRSRVVHGCPVEAIIRAAEGEKADLIAMASHGRTGLARVFYGSVAAGVLHRVDRPLLLVRSRGDE